MPKQTRSAGPTKEAQGKEGSQLVAESHGNDDQRIGADIHITHAQKLKRLFPVRQTLACSGIEKVKRMAQMLSSRLTHSKSK